MQVYVVTVSHKTLLPEGEEVTCMSLAKAERLIESAQAAGFEITLEVKNV